MNLEHDLRAMDYQRIYYAMEYAILGTRAHGLLISQCPFPYLVASSKDIF